MKRNKLNRIISSLMLAAVMVGGTNPLNALANDTVITGESNLPGNPVKDNGITSWDCVYFGNYWQEDTNGDGKADIHDTKQPIKWRVLSVDASGNALLLADKNIEIREYNTTDTDVTWETCTLRSFLNSYGPESNICEEDYEAGGFLMTAFNSMERSAIKTAFTANPNNPVYDTKGGNDTEDKVFLLSLDEAMNPAYGFISNHLKHEYYADRYSTDADETRIALNTGFVDDKPGYEGNDKDTEDVWWMRTPGESAGYASSFYNMGAANASGREVSDKGTAVRPALYLNLSLTSSLWESAGIVYSNTDADNNPQKSISEDTEVISEETINDNSLLTSDVKGKVWTLDTTKGKTWTLDTATNDASSNEITVYLSFKKGTKVKLTGYDKKLSKQFKKVNKLSKKTATITSKGVLKVKKKIGGGELKYVTTDGDIVTVKYTVENT